MYCSECGNKTQDSGKFCTNCGNAINKTKTVVKKEDLLSQKDEKFCISDENMSVLLKSKKNATESSIALAIFAMIITPISYWFVGELQGLELVLASILDAALLIPFIVWGLKMKKRELIYKSDLKYFERVSGWLGLYTLIIVLISLLMGGKIGFLWLFLLYYLYKLNRFSKNVLADKVI